VQVFHATTGHHLGILAGSEGKYCRGISVCADSQGRNLVFVTSGGGTQQHKIDVFVDI
jgi:hypothetical protein